MSKDHCTGIDVGPIYVEHCSSGDINVGISAGASSGVGLTGSAGGYCEISYNQNDGVSAGCGVSAGYGVGAEVPGFGVYSHDTVSYDTRDD